MLQEQSRQLEIFGFYQVDPLKRTFLDLHEPISITSAAVHETGNTYISSAHDCGTTEARGWVHILESNDNSTPYSLMSYTISYECL